MISETNALILALIGGIVPALFWLWFWVREDKLKPEPKSALLSAFIGGVVAVLLALFFELVVYYLMVDADVSNLTGPALFYAPLEYLAEKYNLLASQTVFWDQVQSFFSNLTFFSDYNIDVRKSFLIVFIAPIIEELLKLILTYNICLRRKINDEPIDAAIYMLTAALGFAAVETALFMTESISQGKIFDSLIAGNFRSIGPMLIHLVSSAILGLFIGLAFYKSWMKKFLYTLLGLLVAIILHSLFNFLIILNDTTHNISFFWGACLGTWLLVVVLLVFFEKVKTVNPPVSTGAQYKIRYFPK